MHTLGGRSISGTRTRIVHCLNVATYTDGNDDGIGDFRGLCDRLPYLAGVDVTRGTPMQWSSETSGDFSQAPTRKLIRLVIAHGEYRWMKVRPAAA